MKQSDYVFAHDSYRLYVLIDAILNASIGIFFNVYTIVAVILA